LLFGVISLFLLWLLMLRLWLLMLRLLLFPVRAVKLGFLGGFLVPPRPGPGPWEGGPRSLETMRVNSSKLLMCKPLLPPLVEISMAILFFSRVL
jgi:hypothetical protein